jgi:hypothetical protein
MKTCVGSIVAVIAALMLTGVSSVNARGGGGGGGGGGFGGGGGRGGGGHGGYGGEHGYASRGFYGHGHYYGHGYYGGYCYGGFYGFWPGWYGYYDGWPPYYYDDYYDNYGYPTYYPENTPPDYPQSDSRDFLMLGHDSGKALRLKTVSQGWLVDYLRAYVINAPLNMRDDFRRGFVSGYGDGAESVLKQAIHEARHPKPQGSTAPPAAESVESAKR